LAASFASCPARSSAGISRPHWRGDALGIPPLAMAELLPVIEAVMIRKLNERMASGGLEGRDV
jgi:hypothetical protein